MTTWNQSKFLPDQTTKLLEQDAVIALKEAYKEIYNAYPSNNTLAILYAQTCLETGRFKVGFHCFNWGNIKSRPDDDFFWTMFRCSEVIKGVNTFFDPPHDQCKFRAYKTAIEGAKDYINFLSKRTRYIKAWAALMEGDPAKYSHELHVAGYYTADETIYTKGVVSLTNEFHKKFDSLSSNNGTILPPKTIPQLFEDDKVSHIDWDQYFLPTPKHDEDEDLDQYYGEPKKLGFFDSVKKLFKL